MAECDCGQSSRWRYTKMKRIYIREYDRDGKTKWKPIGWKCPDCHKLELDKEMNK